MSVDNYESRITDPECRRMRAASGRVDDFRPLVALLYEIARDLIPTGQIEERIDRIAQHARPDDDGERGPFMFTNGWLARWAQDVADRFEDATRDPVIVLDAAHADELREVLVLADSLASLLFHRYRHVLPKDLDGDLGKLSRRARALVADEDRLRGRVAPLLVPIDDAETRRVADLWTETAT